MCRKFKNHILLVYLNSLSTIIAKILFQNLVLVTLTLVLASKAFALPTEESLPISPDISEPKTPPKGELPNNPQLETLSQSEEPLKSNPQDSDEEKLYFYKYEEAISLRFGGVFDVDALNDSDPEEKEYSVAVGFKYLFPSETYRHFEFGLDYLTQPKLYLSGLYRFIFNRTEKFRPTLGAGISLRFDEGDKFETPFTLDSYSVYLNMGLEDILSEAKSLRLDLDVHYGNEDFLVLIMMGYSWGF